MTHGKWHDNDWIFASLWFVDCHCIGKCQLIQLRHIVDYFPFIKQNRQFPLFHIYFCDGADIPVKYFLVIIIPYLHHLIFQTVLCPASPQKNLWRIHGFLQHLVQIYCSTFASLHRSQHLNVLQWIHMIISRQVHPAILNDGIHHFLIALFSGKEKVWIFSASHINAFPFIDPVCIHNDPAPLCLTENSGQTYNGNTSGINNIPENIACPDTRKLINISHKNKRHLFRQRF